MTALEALNLKLPDQGIPDTQRHLALAEIEQQIKNYCHIPEVPEALNFVWANMAADLLSYNRDAETSGKISSISEGDTSVHFSGTDIRGTLDGLVLNYRQQLQAFRKPRW